MTEEAKTAFGGRIRDFPMDDYDALMDLWERAGLPGRPKGRDARDAVAEQVKVTSVVFRLL